MEATERLVGSLVFKTSGGTRVPRRVRFPSASASPAYSGFPHAKACNASQPEYREGPTVHPTGESPHKTGTGTPIAVLPDQGANMVYSAPPPNPHP